MNIKRIAALLLASTMLCGALASCKDNKAKTSKNNADNTERNYTADGELPTAADLAGVELEEAVVAQSGDAYLSIIDENWKSQYAGGNDENNPLTYDAGVVHIDKNGDYTVSVNADTKGFRYRSTGDPDKEYKPTGISFAAVVINDAENVLPGAVITVKSVKVDGRDIELKKKSYTNTESGDIRSNIFNEWVSDDSLPSDARTAEGALFNGSAPSEINDGNYSAKVIDNADIKEWTKVEVEFAVSGLAS